MEASAWVERLFAAVDGGDIEAFCAFLDRDVVFRFGNAEPVRGREQARALVHEFLGGIAALRHEIERIWEIGDAVICHGQVTYTRHDRSTLSVPFANVFRRDGDRAREYLVFADVSAL